MAVYAGVSGVVVGLSALASHKVRGPHPSGRRGAGHVLRQVWMRMDSDRRDFMGWMVLCVRAGLLISDMVEFLDLSDDKGKDDSTDGDVGEEPASPPLSAFKGYAGEPMPSLRSTIERMDYTRL